MIQAIGPVEPRDTPYFGLDFYEEKFGAWFFGRETETSKVITNLRAARLTLLHADSGVGKSSLLRGGVAWRIKGLAADSLARHGTARSIPIVFASWKDNPVHELIGAIRMGIGPYLAGRQQPELESDRLDAAIVAASDTVNAGLLIMLDQFEEYFLYRAHESPSGRFVDELTRCINRADLRANFLIAIREDAYAGLGDLFKGRMANVYGNYLHIEYLDRVAAEKAIREPLAIYNSQPGAKPVTIQAELVAAVLDQVRAIDRDVPLGGAATRGDDGRIATPLLQLVMQTLWEKERAAGSHELRLSTLQHLRGVGTIVEAHLGKALNTLDRGGRQAAVDVFGHLVTPSGGKIAESVPDLTRVTGHSEGQVGSVLDRLDQQRVVRSVPAAPERDPLRYRRYEIFHDVLTPAISRLIAVHEEQCRARRLRRLTAFVAALLVVVLAIAASFAYLWHRATTEQAAAESREFAAEAEAALLANNPQRSAQLALMGLGRQDTPEAEDALRNAVPQIQEIRMFPVGSTTPLAMFDPADANKVLSVDQSGSAGIWDAETGRRLVRFLVRGSGSSGSATAAVFNAVGMKVAVGYDNGAAVFDARNGQELHSITVAAPVNGLQYVGGTGELAIAMNSGTEVCLPPYTSRYCHLVSREPAAAIATDPHNQRELAVTGHNGTEVIWTIRGAGQFRRMDLPGSDHYSASFSPDGGEIVTADTDGMLRLYRLPALRPVMTLTAGEPIARSVAFSPDGKLIVAGYSTGRAHVWDASTRLQLAILAGSTGEIEAVSFNSDSGDVVTASDDGTARVWHARPRELRTVFATSTIGGAPAPVVGASYIDDGSRVLAYDSSGRAYVLTAGGKREAVINTGSKVEWTAENKAGTKVVTADQSGSVEEWQAVGTLYTRVHLRTHIHLSGPAYGLGMSGDGTRIAVVPHEDRTIQVINAQTGQLLRTLRSDQDISDVAFSPTGRQVFAGDSNGQVEAWDLPGGRLVLDRPGRPISDVEYDSSGRELVTLTQGASITVWDAPDGRELRQFGVCSSPFSASPSPDGSKIAVGCGDDSVGVYDATTGELLTRLPASTEVIDSVSFSPDGKSIITAVGGSGSPGGVQIWSSALANPSLPAVERIAEHLLHP
jgi:WD40 repeat protein